MRIRSLLYSVLLVPCITYCQPKQKQNEAAELSKSINVKASGFDLKDVKLLNSRFKDNMERNGKWLLSIDTKRLLHSWRVNAGIQTNAEPLGGWEALDCELRGHTMGHVLSGLAMMYASTGNEQYKKKGDSLVTALVECQYVLNQNGYLSAFPQYFIDRCIAGKPVWAPWYTIHKVMAGLIDMYSYAGNREALTALEKMSNWAYVKLKDLSPEQLAIMERNEFGGMIESCYNLYGITGNENGKHLAELFYHHAVLDPLANEQDKLAKLHANTQIPKIIGEARGYELTADEKQKTIASFFWNTVIDHHTYATGGNSDDEHFFTPDQLSAHITARTTETCNTYNMLKLTKHLFNWTADVKYADYYERALYNHILAAQDPETGMASYFMPFKPGLFKVYSTANNSFWCCVGTAFESNAKFAESIYFHDNIGIYVNLFIPSELTWKEKGITLTQETEFPDEATTRFIIKTDATVLVPIYIRYPSWAVSGATVKVNGKKITIKQQPGSYIQVNRKWKAGDKIEVTYPMQLHLVTANDNSKLAAIAYGPIILAGEMGTEGLNNSVPYAKDQDDYNNVAIPSSVISSLNVGNADINNWLKKEDGQQLAFTTTTNVAPRPIKLIPYYQLHHERYVIYWELK